MWCQKKKKKIESTVVTGGAGWGESGRKVEKYGGPFPIGFSDFASISHLYLGKIVFDKITAIL
jgi:hypothetical protein